MSISDTSLGIPPSVSNQPWQAGLVELRLRVQPHSYVAGYAVGLVKLSQHVVLAESPNPLHLIVDIQPPTMFKAGMFPEDVVGLFVPVSLQMGQSARVRRQTGLAIVPHSLLFAPRLLTRNGVSWPPSLTIVVVATLAGKTFINPAAVGTFERIRFF